MIQLAKKVIYQLYSLREYIRWYEYCITMNAIPYDPLISIISTKGNWAATGVKKGIGGLK